MAQRLDKAPTLSDVARVAGVSRWVAGQVVNGGRGNSRVSVDMAQRIRKAARELSYRPNRAARMLLGRRSHVFGLMVASAGDPLTSFLVQYLGYESVKIGCNTLICNVSGREPLGGKQFSYWLDELARQRVDGVFCAIHHWFNPGRKRLLERHPNTVFYGAPGIQGAACVTIDREDAVRQAVRHLLGRGRRRIGLAVMTQSRPIDLARRRGYELELSAHGISFEEELVFVGRDHGVTFPRHNRRTREWEFQEERLDLVVDRLVRDQKADAIVAHDDYWAAALIKRLRRRGVRVPEDVAIVGYLNHYLADWTDPSLTTIDLRHRVAARVMVRMLESMVVADTSPADRRVVSIRPKLIVRGST